MKNSKTDRLRSSGWGSVAKQAVSSDSLFELGKLYCERGDFKVAIEKLTSAADSYYSEKNFDGYLQSMNLLLRMYAEMEDQKSINATKEKLQDLVLKENVELNAKTYYSLGLCAAYKGQHKTALEYLEKSLALALSNDSKEEICYAISGLANVYTLLGRYDDALKEIYNLQVFFQVLPMRELKLSSLLLNGHILKRMNRFDEALEIFWQAYDLLKDYKNFYMYVSLLYAMGITHADAGDSDMAKMYLQLAKRSVDPENLKFLSKKIDERLEELGAREDSRYDLIFDQAGSAVIEKKKGRVDFRNQFILLDLLRLFVQHPGEVYSKEALVRKVWKQDYDPRVHDNKIYVTIKRLRKMIEPDYSKPKYIFRAKNGYFLNKNAKVLVEH